MMKPFYLFALAAFGLIPALSAQDLRPATTLPLQDQSFPVAGAAPASLASLAGTQGTVLVFWANKCAWVDRYEARVLDLAREYGGRGYGFVLVNSFGGGSAAESAEASATRAAEKGYALPYILDSDGALAKAVGAQRAPQVFVYDASGQLRYAGAIDDKPSDAAGVSSFYLRDALDAGLAGRAPAAASTPALGCLIAF